VLLLLLEQPLCHAIGTQDTKWQNCGSFTVLRVMYILPSPCHSVSGGHGLGGGPAARGVRTSQPPIKVRPNQASRCAQERRSKSHGPLAPCEPELLLPLGARPARTNSLSCERLRPSESHRILHAGPSVRGFCHLLLPVHGGCRWQRAQSRCQAQGRGLSRPCQRT
jgi:hypothetical protein